MGKLLNPYIAGAPILESSMFFGREDVFSWIERSLSGKYVDHILVIHGQRRVGKTSVLKQIPNYLDDKYLQVFFDLQGRMNTSLERFLYWIARETSRTLQKEYDLDIPKPDQQSFTENTEYLIAEFFPGLQNILSGRVLLLTFDEFDTLARDDIQESLAGPLIDYLRRLMDLKGLNFIFSIGSSGNKLENMQASYTDFFKTALYRKISFLDRSSCQQLITKPVEGEIKYQKKAVNKIYEITAGHPYFTQLTCHELFSLCQKTGIRDISADDVESVVEDVIERGTVNLKFVWDEASDLEKWVLASLAQLSSGASNQKITSLLSEQRVRFVESDLNSAILHLREKDVISKENRFIIHLMRLWLQQNRPLDRVKEELTEVNPIANRFIEIGDEYKDRGEFEKAIDSYQQALDNDPKNLRATLNLAQTYLETENYQEAVDTFEKTLNIDPEDVAAQTGICDTFVALGNQVKAQGDNEGAILYYQRVLTFNESHTDARQQLSDIYHSQANDYLAAGKDDQALSLFNQALEYTPENEDLSSQYEELLGQKKVEVIAGWLQKADKAVNRHRWDAAIEAVENALKIDPEDRALITRLAEVKDTSRQHQLEIYRTQIDQARTAENWDEAISTLQKAIQLDSEDQSYITQLADIKEAKRQSQLTNLKEIAERAVGEMAWEDAINALEQAAVIAQDDPGWEVKIREVKQDQHNAQLEGLRSKAEAAAGQERWEKAIQNWEEYLLLNPEDSSAAKEALQYAQKYETILRDYQQAEESIRKKNFSRAVELLQGIIAQDPAYKATSRLLVEAVEAKEQKTIWKSGWLYGVVGIITLAVVVVIYRTELLSAFSKLKSIVSVTSTSQATSTVQTALNPTFTYSPQPTTTPTPNPAEVFALPYLSYISETAPDFEDDFSTVKDEWGLNVFGVSQVNSTEYVSNGSFNADIYMTNGEHKCVKLGDLEGATPLKANQFVLTFDINFSENSKEAYFTIRFRSSGGNSGYHLMIQPGEGVSSAANWRLFFAGIEEDSDEYSIMDGETDLFFLDGNTIQLIVGQTDGAVLINQQPLTYFPNLEEGGSLNQIEICTTDTVEVNINNVQFWDLDEVEISPQETPSTPSSSSLGIGSTKVSPKDGMTMVYVPAGEFLMGSNDGEDDQTPVHEVYLDAFWMDETEVTASQFQQFMEEENRSVIPYPIFAGDNHPVARIDWYDAKAYCEWAGRRLPTEAEWEKAARGGLVGATYPWGNSEPVRHEGAENGAQVGPPSGTTVPVKTFAPNGYGLYDMAGNVWELVADWYDAEYYAAENSHNPAGPVEGNVFKVMRGGSWYVYNNNLSVSHRAKNPIAEANENVGFRCVQNASVESEIPVTPIPKEENESSQISPVDEMTMMYVPAGEFEMGSEEEGEPDESPVHTVYLDAFWMDQHEVTFEQFQEFVEVEDYTADPCGGGEDHPVACVDWNDANAYCEWAGRRLPTEAEWEKAARGGLEENTFPWGNQDPVCEPGAENGAQIASCPGITAPVKNFSPNGYGFYDMAGNVWEWVADWYGADYFKNSPDENPQGPSSGSSRVLRGGSGSNFPQEVRAATRGWYFPDITDYIFGFRCAKNID